MKKVIIVILSLCLSFFTFAACDMQSSTQGEQVQSEQGAGDENGKTDGGAGENMGGGTTENGEGTSGGSGRTPVQPVSDAGELNFD